MWVSTQRYMCDLRTMDYPSSRLQEFSSGHLPLPANRGHHHQNSPPVVHIRFISFPVHGSVLWIFSLTHYLQNIGVILYPFPDYCFGSVPSVRACVRACVIFYVWSCVFWWSKPLTLSLVTLLHSSLAQLLSPCNSQANGAASGVDSEHNKKCRNIYRQANHRSRLSVFSVCLIAVFWWKTTLHVWFK